jgi:hypothetical protein
MDLREFLNVHISNNTIGNIIEGVGQSTFADTNINIYELVKNILSKLLMSNEKQRIYNQLQSGGIVVPAVKKNETDKKQSYCTDFNLILNNLLALLGYEFSKYLMYLSTLKHHIKKITLMLKNSSSYEEILYLITCMENIYKLGESSLTGESLMIGKEFDYKKYILTSDKYTTSDFIFQTESPMKRPSFSGIELVSPSNEIAYQQNVSSQNGKNIFSQLKTKLDIVIKSGSIINFEKDKELWLNMFDEMISCTSFQGYIINTIDELCINLGNFDVGYDGSFLKLFDMLYRENYTDIPRDYVEPKIYLKVLPHITYLKELEIGSCDIYLNALNKYFRKIYNETYKSLSSVSSTIEVFKIDVTDNMYEYLSHISLNLFVQITRNIANNQVIQTCFGKSTRIQFIQILTAVHGCLPKLQSFTESQKNTLHYFLLSKKTLQESFNIMNKKFN